MSAYTILEALAGTRVDHVLAPEALYIDESIHLFSPASRSDIVTVPREYQQLYFPQVEITLTHNYSSSRLSVIRYKCKLGLEKRRK